ncbi:uncharacterized protein LOC124116342 [Haliotis rufescens]|uniref:uncharacterized protein LOC124116342 n=1 Tax=Haliotis rufescens TaxID=6454 RepID=UPI001EB01920|nr:uncharacterized protein LOC124116342 [Haliotis rufescens]
MMALWPVVILAGFFPFLESKTLTQLETNNLNRFLGEVARCARVPAISMSLVRDGQIVYTNGFGTSNKQRQESASSKTVFCLGDITQTFTATLLAKLLDEHQNFTWDTPVQEILGAAINFGDRYRNDYLSLRDIVSMRTGLSNMDAVVLTNAMERSRLISNLRFAPKVATFREKYVYNNLLFAVAEEVTRSLGQDTWYKLVQDHLLAPLSMTDTFFITSDAKKQENLAQPVMSYNGVPMPIPMGAMKGQEIIAAGSSICSTADDMGKWLRFNLNKGGTQDGGQLLPREALAELFQGQTTRSDEGNARVEGFSQPDVQVSYTREANTLGWIKGHYRGYSVLSQDGSLPGYESLTSFIPDRDVGIFTAFTGDNGPKAFAAKTLMNTYGLDMLIHGQPAFHLKDFCQTLDAMFTIVVKNDPYVNRDIKQASESKRPLEDYQAFYRNLAFGDIRVWVNESSLYLKYGEMGEFNLRPTEQENVFRMEAMPGELWYTTHVDILRRKPYYAYFDTTPYSDDHIEVVKIPHFDRDTDPVFSRRIRIPPPYDEVQEVCGSGSKVAVSWTIVVLMMAMVLR